MGTGKFLLRRGLQGIYVVWGVVTLMFILRAASPGDPVNLLVDPAASEARRERAREAFGLNDPLYVQYFDYLTDLLQGDLGFSFRSERDVTMLVLERVPATLELAIAATIVALVIAIPLGVISASNRNEPSDWGATLFSLLGISTPNFWLGVMLILIFAVQLGWLPTGRRAVGFHEGMLALVLDQQVGLLWEWFKHILLPAITLGTYFTALITRLTRSGMLDELGKSYVQANRAKGLPRILTKYKHVLRNTMIPIITVLGLQLGALLGGAVITETVFNWPGLGDRLIGALNQRDWPVIQGIIVFTGVSYVVINILVDGLYASLDPRVTE